MKKENESKKNTNAIKWTTDPTSPAYLLWLAIISLFYVYNIFSITIRYTFLEDDLRYSNIPSLSPSSNFSNRTMEFNFLNNETSKVSFGYGESNLRMILIDGNYLWFLFDYLADLMFLIDIFLVQTRMKFLSEGLWVFEFRQTSCQYFKSSQFIVRKKQKYAAFTEL